MAYLTGCFIEVSFNFAEWQQSTRILVALIEIVIATLIAAANYENNSH